MGYTTHFTGTIKVSPELNLKDTARLQALMWEDIRDHKDWQECIAEFNSEPEDMTYMDLEYSSQPQLLEWDQSEKTYHMAEKLQFIIQWMRRTVPTFSLDWEFYCQGEEYNDRYYVKAKDWRVWETEQGIMLCPHCKKDVDIWDF